MAGTKEIRLKIKSVQNTRKITKAMEMVAASKMKKAQERMRRGRPYAQRLLNITMHAARANTEYKHPLLTRRGGAVLASCADFIAIGAGLVLGFVLFAEVPSPWMWAAAALCLVALTLAIDG